MKTYKLKDFLDFFDKIDPEREIEGIAFAMKFKEKFNNEHDFVELLIGSPEIKLISILKLVENYKESK